MAFAILNTLHHGQIAIRAPERNWISPVYGLLECIDGNGFRTMQLVSKVSKLALAKIEDLNETLATFLRNAGRDSMITWTTLGIVNVGKNICDAGSACGNWYFAPTEEVENNKILLNKAFNKTVIAISSTGYALSTLAGWAGAVAQATTFRLYGDIFDSLVNLNSFCNHVYSFLVSGNEYSAERNDNDNVEVIRQAMDEAGCYHFLKVAKAICSLASFIIGVAAFWEVTLVSEIAVYTISLVGTLFSLGATLYKDVWARYDIVEFHNRPIQHAV